MSGDEADHDCDTLWIEREDTGEPVRIPREVTPTYPVIGAVEGPDGIVTITVELSEALHRQLTAALLGSGSLGVSLAPVPPPLCRHRPDRPLSRGAFVPVPWRLR